MPHSIVRVLADLAIVVLIIIMPVLWVVYTDRFRQTPTPSQYAGMFMAAAFAGILLFLPALSIVAFTALFAIALAWLSGHYAFAGVTFERHLEPRRLFPGDDAELILKLRNHKILALAWLTITDPVRSNVMRGSAELGASLEFFTKTEMLESNLPALVIRSAVAPFQELKRTYRIKAHQRGVYSIGPAEIRSGDPFGIFPKEANIGERQDIIVYPRVYQPNEIDLPFREVLGEVVTRRSLFEDPTLLAGSRDYLRGDPLRLIHWKATARTGELQSRVSDASTTAQLMIVLNLHTAQHYWQGIDPERMEAGIDLAASIGVWALEKGFAVGLHSNGSTPGIDLPPRLTASASPQQSTVLLEHLARLSGWTRFTSEQILLDEMRRLNASTSIVFVTSIITLPLITLLTSRNLHGRSSVVYCGRNAAPVVPGLPIHLVAPAAERIRAVS